MTAVLWTRAAQEDLREIHRYITNDSVQYADLVIAAVTSAVARLQQFPESGRVVPEYGRPDLREVIWKSYRIAYHHIRARDQVHVLTVFRSERAFPQLRGGHGGA
jgi:addiction module RelE/StbE family toxin